MPFEFATTFCMQNVGSPNSTNKFDYRSVTYSTLGFGLSLYGTGSLTVSISMIPFLFLTAHTSLIMMSLYLILKMIGNSLVMTP